MIQDTTLESYAKLKDEGKVCPRQKEIMWMFNRHGNLTDRALARFTGLPINSITPRRNELVKLNLVERKEKIYDPETKRTVISWGIV